MSSPPSAEDLVAGADLPPNAETPNNVTAGGGKHDSRALGVRQRMQLAAHEFADCAADEAKWNELGDRRPPETGMGAGPLVALVGDSLLVQQAPALLDDTRFRMVVVARCWQPTSWLLETPAVNNVLARNPAVAWIGTGANDVMSPSGPDPNRVSAQLDAFDLVLDATDHVPCRVVPTTPETSRNDAVSAGGEYISMAQRLNAQRRSLAERHPNVHFVEWAAVVEQQPELLFDGVHLTPKGIETYGALLRDAIAEQCGLTPES